MGKETVIISKAFHRAQLQPPASTDRVPRFHRVFHRVRASLLLIHRAYHRARAGIHRVLFHRAYHRARPVSTGPTHRTEPNV